MGDTLNIPAQRLTLFEWLMVALIGGSMNKGGFLLLVFSCFVQNLANASCNIQNQGVPFGCEVQYLRNGSIQLSKGYLDSDVICGEVDIPNGSSCYRMLKCNQAGIDQCHLEGSFGIHSFFSTSNAPVKCAKGSKLRQDAFGIQDACIPCDHCPQNSWYDSNVKKCVANAGPNGAWAPVNLPNQSLVGGFIWNGNAYQIIGQASCQ